MSNVIHANPLKKELDFFISHQNELVEKYNGKTLIIKDSSVVKVFENEEDAYFYGIEHFELGDFMIQECIAGEEAYTQTFRSRVSFE